VLIQSVHLSEGANQYDFDMSNLAKGIYLVELEGPSDRMFKRWMLE
jgi:hypothetical protein